MNKQGYIPCLHVYAAGKAQEIVRLFNVYTHLPVIVNPLLDGVNVAYQKAGHALDWMSAPSAEGREGIEKNPCVYVNTPSAEAVDIQSNACPAFWYEIGRAHV